MSVYPKHIIHLMGCHSDPHLTAGETKLQNNVASPYGHTAGKRQRLHLNLVCKPKAMLLQLGQAASQLDYFSVWKTWPPKTVWQWPFPVLWHYCGSPPHPKLAHLGGSVSTCHCEQPSCANYILHLLPFCTLFQKHCLKPINGTRKNLKHPVWTSLTLF